MLQEDVSLTLFMFGFLCKLFSMRGSSLASKLAKFSHGLKEVVKPKEVPGNCCIVWKTDILTPQVK